MKTYYYSLDNHKRFNHITEEFISYYKMIELTDEQYQSIKLGKTGLVDGQLVEIGQTDYEKSVAQYDYHITRIVELKQLLADTDWKVIVNTELQHAGLPIKYEQLHQERQAWRDEINLLEQTMPELLEEPIIEPIVEEVEEVVEEIVEEVYDPTFEDIEAAAYIPTQEEVEALVDETEQTEENSVDVEGTTTTE